MKKKLLYVALGLMGIMGTLSIGVVDAATVIPHPENVINYTLNGNENFTAGTITVIDGETTITILDRNLGATAAGTGCENSNGGGVCAGGDPTYGYVFQWGNNYGFTGVGNLPAAQKNYTQVSASDVGANYSSGVFHYSNQNWINDNSKVDMWGGSIEYIDTLTPVQAALRRGPCPKNFHVPSIGELNRLKAMMGNDVLAMHNDLKIPFAGFRDYDADVFDPGRSATLWSSSPDSDFNTESRTLLMYMYGYMQEGSNYRANANSVRCFYNEYAEYVAPAPANKTITYNPNGGAFSGMAVNATKDVVFTKDENENYVPDINIQFPNKESEDMAAQSGWMFDGWYTTSVFADQTTTTEWTGYVDENTESQTVYARWLPFNDLPIEGTDYVIMDRNLGATDVWNYGDAQNTAAKNGKYYQWGNNYGFSSDSSISPWPYTSDTPVDASAYGPGNYYSSATFIGRSSSPYAWDTTNNANLWGGTSSRQSDKQGPCPAGYHVPTTAEWKAIYDALYLSEDSRIILQTTLHLPMAGGRNFADSRVDSQGSYGNYWSSSRYNADYAYNLLFFSFAMSSQSYSYHSNGFSVRCLKDSPTHTLTFNATENGASTTSQSSAEAITGSSVTLPSCNETKTGFTCIGWNTDATAHEGLASITLNEDKTVYAIFKKDITATYTATNASISGNQTSGSCTLWNKDTSCSITLPSITCNAGYHSPVWSPENLNNITTNSSATASCTQCEAGYYCPAGSAKAECTGRTQYSAAGASACSDVTAGHYTTGCEGDNKCTGQSQCTAGTACSGGVQSSCVASTSTTAGTYSASAGATSCTTATDGKYVTTAKATAETQCPAGSYCPGGKIIACPSGYISDAEASAESDCYKILTATFNENGATLSSNSATCNLYYGSGSCPISAPTITAAAEFDVVGFNTDANATNGTTPTNISADITYYAITKSSSPIQITFDINGNGGASSTRECYRYNGSGSCSVTSPDITPADGFTVIGWNADSDTHTSQWNTGTANTVSSSTTYYAQSEKAGYQVTASYTVGTGVSAIGATSGKCNVDTIYNGSGYLPCNIILTTIDLKPGYNTGVWSTGNNVLNPGSGVSLLSDDTYTASATPNDNTQYLVHYYQQNLSGAYDLFETYTGAGTTDTIATAVEKTYSGFAFSGTNTNNKLTGNIDGYGSLELKLYYDRSEYKLSFVVDGNVVQSGTVAYAAAITAPADPTKDCNAFAGWSSSVAGVTTAGTMPDSDVTFTANWNYTCSRSSGGGGGGGRTTSPIDVVNETLDNNVQNPTDQKENGEIVDNLDNTEGNKSGEAVYSDEFKEAYEFAHSKGITTMPTIQQANMESPLTRIAMAKMLSYYAINVLGQKPDTSKTIKFKDVSNKLNTQYDNGVILAYQLGIMGINMKNNKFRPNDPVTRGEFGTALSRMLYKIADGKKNYYSTHLAKLMEEKIITNDNPNMKELRGYVMIMLKRSAENK